MPRVPHTRSHAAARDDIELARKGNDEVHVTLPPGFDFGWVLGFLAARTVPSIESVGEGEYRRSVRLNEKPVVLRLRAVGAGNGSARSRTARELVATGEPAFAPNALAAAVIRMLDLDADLDRFRRLARRDPILAAIVRRRSGIRLPQLLDPFEGLTRAILGQQVSVAGASTMTDRLVGLFARPVPGARHTEFLAFPTAADVADAGADRLRAIGLTRARAATLASTARHVADGALDLERLRELPGEDAQSALVSLPGIGPWTASYVRMRALGDRDAFPAADLGVVKALEAAGVERRSIATVAERWRPWRGYATLHLWASLRG
jgi:AraC family transcriptional regulator, regulatory protein of adaptative response / DNA-3-methyladenine glycosylase II